MSSYMIRDFVPRRVSVDGEVADSELLERWLSEKKGKKVIISHSTAGEQKKLFEMCRSNALKMILKGQNCSIRIIDSRTGRI